MGLREMFRRQGPNERAARAELRAAQHDGLGVSDRDASTYAERIQLARELDRDPARVQAGLDALRADAERELPSALRATQEHHDQPGEDPDPQALRSQPEPEPEPQRVIHAVTTPEMTQAVALQQDMFHQMTLENTPAAFMDDSYSYDDDVWMSDDDASERLERDLRTLVRAHPEQFAGTRFEPYLADEPEAPDPGSTQPSSHEHDQHEHDEDEYDPPF